jgi:hypothetical protein
MTKRPKREISKRRGKEGKETVGVWARPGTRRTRGTRSSEGAREVAVLAPGAAIPLEAMEPGATAAVATTAVATATVDIAAVATATKKGNLTTFGLPVLFGPYFYFLSGICRMIGDKN